MKLLVLCLSRVYDIPSNVYAQFYAVMICIEFIVGRKGYGNENSIDGKVYHKK